MQSKNQNERSEDLNVSQDCTKDNIQPITKPKIKENIKIHSEEIEPQVIQIVSDEEEQVGIYNTSELPVSFPSENLEIHPNFCSIQDSNKDPLEFNKFDLREANYKRLAVKKSLKNSRNPATAADNSTEYISDKEFVCNKCGKTFAQRRYLRNHNEMVHLRKYMKTCEICGVQVTCSTALKLHLKIHLKEVLNFCYFCKLGFKTYQNLKLHIYTHTKEKPQFCSFCPKSFARADVLNHHLCAHANGNLNSSGKRVFKPVPPRRIIAASKQKPLVPVVKATEVATSSSKITTLMSKQEFEKLVKSNKIKTFTIRTLNKTKLSANINCHATFPANKLTDGSSFTISSNQETIPENTLNSVKFSESACLTVYNSNSTEEKLPHFSCSLPLYEEITIKYESTNYTPE